MLMNPNYEPRTLLEAFDVGPIAHTFLRDTFFAARDYPPTSLVEFDFRRGRRRMAPFVAPLVGGKVMERMGYETRFFRAPRIAPVRNLRTADLEARLPGETIYQGRQAADRAADLLAEDAIYLDEAITRREEWMCRNVLVNGGLTVTADNGYTDYITYLEYATPGQPNVGPSPPANVSTVNNHYIPGTAWDQTNSDPLTDLENARLQVIKLSGISPNVCLMSQDTRTVFLNNPKVYNILHNRRIEYGLIQPIIQDEAVVRIGNIPGLEIYTYAEYFEDDYGNLFPMIPGGLCLLLSTNHQNKIVYGAFTQLEDARAQRFVTYQTARIPFVYGDEQNGHLFYRLTSCPLPMPLDVLGYCVIEALSTAGHGPYGFEAKFKTDNPGPKVGDEDRGPATGNEHQSRGGRHKAS
jgi:hypothetical protein